MPYFSIIIPVYNVAPYLRECLDSVLAQTFTDWEVICVDDGSTDGSGEILEEYAAKDKRFKVVHQENQGVVAARVNGFNQSKGEMLLFIDGDDEIEIKTLNLINECQRKYDIDIIQYGYKMRPLNGESVLSENSITGCFSTRELAQKVKKTPLEFLGMCLWNKCYRRKIAENSFAMVSKIRISHSEDGLFAFAAFVNAAKMLFLEDSLYVYKLREGSAVTRVNRKIVKEKVLFINKMEELARKSGFFTNKQISRVISYHKYEASSYVFVMLSRNGGVLADYKLLFVELQKTDFLSTNNLEWRGIKRRVLKFLLFHPRTSWLLHFLRIAKF
jgi:glycosyltransferase involved in cell wall biosynthesis